MTEKLQTLVVPFSTTSMVRPSHKHAFYMVIFFYSKHREVTFILKYLISPRINLKLVIRNFLKRISREVCKLLPQTKLAARI